jgi:urease accessory protein
MRLDDLRTAAGWRARLDLGYERRGARTVLAERRHDGPLVVQKALYPEGDEVCHTIVVHPPAGIAGGDELDLRIRAAPGAHALLTTPGAGKWYRSAGPWARQRIAVAASGDACVEWLPQETIVFDGAMADLRCDVALAGDARYIGWEILCFGRTGSGERFARGTFLSSTRIVRDGVPLWIERGQVDGGGRLLDSPAGLGGQPICATLVAAAPAIPDTLVSECRAIPSAAGEAAVTRLPGVLVARWRGASSEVARGYFARLWRCVRPALARRVAREPRIWRT